MRIVTRGDMDGLTGSVIVSLNETVDDIELIHPQDVTNNRVEIHKDDVLINVPYHPDCGLWFDHHAHTATYPKPPKEFKGLYRIAPSAAGLAYEYFGGPEAMPEFEELVRETDRFDSADLRPGDVITPQDYIQLGFTIDGRTGIGQFRDYFLTLFELVRKAPPIDEVLAHPAVAQRCRLMSAQQETFTEVLGQHSRLEGNVVVTDLRPLDEVPVGNRFLVYAVFPAANVSIRLHWGPRRETVIAVIGHSIFDRSCTTDVGELAARFGGGGHRGAGSAPLEPENVDGVIEVLLKELRS
ncbi:MAG: exopolyphosphatase [Acidobacteria bacterium]|nr:exopolyphosphatase [Candidatus Sulfomarinibacter kjeldsenii]